MRGKNRWFLNEGQVQMVSQLGAITDGFSIRGKNRWLLKEGQVQMVTK
jgi:hypothetical protein